MRLGTNVILKIYLSYLSFKFITTIADEIDQSQSQKNRPLVCPCRAVSNTVRNTTTALRLCFHGFDKESNGMIRTFRVQQPYILVRAASFIVLENLNNINSRCDVIFYPSSNISDGTGNRPFQCPGQCLDTPVVSLNLTSIKRRFTTVSPYRSILCSLTGSMVHSFLKSHNISDINNYNTLALIFIGMRRINECNEVPLMKPTAATAALPSREIKILLVYTGSLSRHDLLLSQQQIIRHAPFHGSSAVMSWLAMEDLYPCQSNTLKCLDGSLDKTYTKMNYLPGYPLTDLHSGAERWVGRSEDEYNGWACAQRRPLRALAHTLYLFSPKLLILLDDDTYINWGMFQKMFPSFIAIDKKKPSVFGAATTSTLLGGAGLILGGSALERLVQHKLYVQYERKLPTYQQV